MELAREALCMYLNNKSVAAEELFMQHGCDNYHVKMAHCFTIVMNAVMAFERCELDRATSVLKTTERELAPNTGLVSHIRDKLNVRQQLREEDLVELLERQIILADCQVCSAALCFLQQEIGSFIKGAMGLRRAWKTYDRIYGQISSMYARRHQTAAESEAVANRAGFFPVSSPATSSATASSKSSIPPSSLPLLPASSSSPCLSAVAAGSVAGPSTSRVPGGFSPLKRSRSRSKLMLDSSRDMSSETVDRLMGSVSFGYGVFQLVVSLLPDNIVKVAQLLGFQSDRGLALSALNLCRSSVDFRAPLASFTLLAYHTILRPLLSLDGGGATSRGSSGIDGATSGGVAAAALLIDELRPKFSRSPLLHYFNGRRLRLQSDLSGSIEAQRHAVTLTNQLEIRLLCLHEIGWCYLLQLNWVETYVAFSQLSEQTRWNKSFFQYLAAVTTGASGDLTQAAALLTRVQSSQCSSGASATASQPHGGGAGGPRGSAEVEAFIVRRAATSGLLPHQPPSKEAGGPTADSRRLVYKLMAYELLFLWNALPCCPHAVWRQILADCDAVIACSGVESAPARGPEELHRPRVGCPSLSQWHAVAHLISGGVYDNLDLLRAETHYRRALQLSGRNRHGGDGLADLYVAPFASYELADIYCGRPEKRSEGRKLLLSARDDFKNFDFQARLSIRTQCALRRLERETSRKK